MADDFDLLLEDPSVLAALDNLERQHCINGKSRAWQNAPAGAPQNTPAQQGPANHEWPTQYQQWSAAPGHPAPQAPGQPPTCQHNEPQRQPQMPHQSSMQDGSQLNLQQTAPGRPLSQGCGPASLHQPGHHEARRGPSVTVYSVLAGAGRAGFKLPYNEALLSILKRIEGHEWNGYKKLWTVPMSRREQAAAALCACPTLSVRVEPLPMIVNSVLQACSNQPDDSELYARIPEAMEKKLMEFQRIGIKFGLSKGGRVLLGDEMGLGKTVQAVALLACYKDEWPCLIITPSSLREQWADALFLWLGISGNDIHVVYEKRDCDIARRRFKFLIVSYDYIPKIRQELERQAFKVIVCDESHYIKNHKAVRTKETVPLLKAARRCILCSGTPALSRPIEILQQMLALVPKAKVTVNSFAERYCQGSHWSKLSGASNLEELHALCTSTFMKRRLKKDVMDQLPPKMRQQIYLQLRSKDIALLKPVQQQLDQIKVVLKQCQQTGADVAGAKNEEKRLLNELYIKSAEAKVSAVQEYVSDLLENDDKFLIFGHHKDILDGIEQRLRSKKVRFIRIDGSTPAHERQGLVTAFQEDEGVKVAVLSLRAAGVGLTLTAAHLVVMAELSWTPGELLQAEDRAHRIGQADSVAVHYLHARNTIDDIIWQTIGKKLENVGQTLDGSYDKLEVDSSTTASKQNENKRAQGSCNTDSTTNILGLLQQQHQRQQNQQQSAHNTNTAKVPNGNPVGASGDGIKTTACHQEPRHPNNFLDCNRTLSRTSPKYGPDPSTGRGVIDLTAAEDDFRKTALLPASKRLKPC